MIADFFYSIAGKKANDTVESLIHSIIDTGALQPAEVRIFEYTLECGAKGNYPSRDYYRSMGYDPINPTNSLSQIAVMVDSIKDFLLREKATRDALKGINTSTSYADLIDKLRSIADTNPPPDTIDLSLFSAEITEFSEVRADDNAYKLGISDIDALTGGFQPGTTATIAAYTGQGKSTLLVSSMFKNIKEGRHGVYFSLEVSPSVVKLQFFARYCYDIHAFTITPKDIMEDSLTDEERKRVDELLPEYNEFVAGKLLIVDEALLSEAIIKDFKKLQNLYKAFDTVLGCFSFVGYDHINQIDLMFKDMGNIFIRTLVSAGKTFINSAGKCPCTIMCAQVNRDGWRRAVRRNGKYDMVSLADLNEIERGSVYVVFLYTSDDLKLLQETKVSMTKHRYGGVLTEPVNVNFNAASFFVGEEVENISFGGEFSFLRDDDAAINIDTDDFDDF